MSTYFTGIEREGLAPFIYLLKGKLDRMQEQNSTSILDAIRDGVWDYEPPEMDNKEFDATKAMPGSSEKLDILAERIESGVPLWHPKDRMCYDDSEFV